MSLIDQIRNSQVHAAEMAVVKNLHDSGLCTPDSCSFCREAFQKAIAVPPMATTLEDKLALMIWYLEEVRQRRRSSDPKGFEALLDDTEVSTWLDKMNKAGRIRNTRFTQTRNS